MKIESKKRIKRGTERGKKIREKRRKEKEKC